VIVSLDTAPAGEAGLNADAHPAKIRTFVVDDEPLARSNLTVLLRRDPQVVIVGECGSGVDAPDEIRRANPDLLFLDIQMPECDGFDVLALLGKQVPPAVVFVTAYDQYALRAFEAGALDYLLKPFDTARFERALDRAKQKVLGGFRGTVEGGKSQPPKLERLVIKSAGEVAFVSLSEIDWIEAADYYAALHVGAKTHLLRRSMAELEQDLDPEVFCRIHRSTIVNLERVQGLKLHEDGEYRVVIQNGTELRLSRRYRKQVQSRMGVRLSD
jgi:two-component system, LytTR family, response regulator